MKRNTLFLTVFVLLFGGFIGFDPFTPSQTVGASEMVIPKVIEVPNKELSLFIDVNKGEVSIGENSKNATVTIISGAETRQECRTIPIREKKIYVENTVKITRLLNKLMPLEKPALGLNLSPKINDYR